MNEPAGGTQSVYPHGNSARDRWILDKRGPKNSLDPWRPYAYTHEEELGPDGEFCPTATIFLTNRECPYRCLMCDLWRNTLEATVPIGAIPAQIEFALQNLPAARQVKLYNAGSFFDPRAIPAADYAAIIDLVADFDRVVVECHPALVAEPLYAFARRLGPRLEVALGLETAHPSVLEKLNKRMTLDRFANAAVWLKAHDIDLRVFILVRPPFISESEGAEWACRSLDFAFECGATVCSLIPTRSGNGAMEELGRSGDFSQPSLSSLEAAMEYGLRIRRGRVFADLWDIAKFYRCKCSVERAERLRFMNETQTIPPPVSCSKCETVRH